METTTLSDKKTETHILKQKWESLKQREPKMRTRQIAEKIGVSEAELVSSAVDGNHIIRLNDNWEGIFQSLESLGQLMALTRNEAAVHEKTGVYRNVSFEGHAGLVLDENIDLRVFHKRWGFGFALPVKNPRGVLHSLQFFDKKGHAVHKIYLKKNPDLKQYRRIVNQFKSVDQTPSITINEPVKKESVLAHEVIETDAFLDAWSELKDTHDFYPMLRKFKVERTHALEIAREKFSWKVKNHAVRRMLTLASERKVPIMVFVRNSGMIQIHSGPVSKIRIMRNWVNVMDPEFNLHLREDLIDQSWIVEKPTEDGIVTSLEIFDEHGEQVATFFGARKPGKPELASWREITCELKKTEGIV